MPLRLELGLELEIIFEDAVVDDGEASVAVAMWVGVVVCRAPMGCPSRVAEAYRPAQRIRRDEAMEPIDPAHAAPYLEARRVLDDQPRRVIAAVLESTESAEQDVDRIPGAYVSEDSTHGDAPCVSGARGAVVRELQRVGGQVTLPRASATQLQHGRIDIVQTAPSGHGARKSRVMNQSSDGFVVVVGFAVGIGEAAHRFSGHLLDGDL